jgi:hypothetical protein
VKIPYADAVHKHLGAVLWAIGGLVVGFLTAALIFGAPWHLPPNWGDIPTWLAFLAASVGGTGVLLQLAQQQGQINDQSARNRQLDEARIRGQAERVEVEGIIGPDSGTVGRVLNASDRPIRDITCRIMSRVDNASLGTCHEYIGPQEVGAGPSFGTTTGNRVKMLRPNWQMGFMFKSVTTPDRLIVAWFTDDAGFRWQLDEDLHLAPAAEDDLFLPIIPERPWSAR